MKKVSSLKKSVLFGIFLLAFYFGGSNLLVLLLEHYNIYLTDVQAILISQLGLILVPVIIYFILTRDNIVRTLKLYPLNPDCLLKVILFAFCIQPLVMTVSAIGNLFFTNYTASTMLSLSSAIPYPVMLLLAALLPAIIEETSLRGIMLSGFKGHLTFPSAVINGLVFAILHGNIQQGLYAFILGFVFVYLVNAAGSIFASMITHFIINATSITMAYAMSQVYEKLDISNTAIDSKISLSINSPGVITTIIILAILAAVFTFLAYLLYKSIKNQGRKFFKDRSNTIRL